MVLMAAILVTLPVGKQLVVNGKFKYLPINRSVFFENALIGKSQDSSFIMYKGDEWSNYSLNVAVKSFPSEDAKAATGICFGVEDPNQYHCLKWKAIEGTGKFKMEVSKKRYQETQVLTAFETPWQTDKWNKVEISLNERNITVKVNNEEPVETPVSYTIKGGIGLLLEGEITAYFDDIHVRTIIDNETR